MGAKVFLQHLAWEATNHTTLLPTHEDFPSTMKSSLGMILFPSCSDKEQWSRIITGSNTAFALTGSAALGQLGPTIGLMDIGESDDAYLFRVALPGVKRDAQEFTCNVESDGKVLIRESQRQEREPSADSHRCLKCKQRIFARQGISPLHFTYLDQLILNIYLVILAWMEFWRVL